MIANFDEIEEARKLLGLGEAATLKEINTAYRTLAHRHHPDKHSSVVGEETAETIKRLNWEYKLLMDYCDNYEYSVKEEDIARTYSYDEYLRTFKDKWYKTVSRKHDG